MARIFKIVLLAVYIFPTVATLQPCPVLPPTSFVLPSPLSTLREIEGGMYSFDHGVQLTDINGDSLPDLVWGWENNFDPPTNPNDETWLCVYLNTQCGWVLQANYTGPDTTCLPSNTITVRGVEFFWRPADTVGNIVDDIVAEFGIKDSIDTVWLSSTSGTRYARRNMISEVVKSGMFLHLAGEVVPVAINSQSHSLRNDSVRSK